MKEILIILPLCIIGAGVWMHYGTKLFTWLWTKSMETEQRQWEEQSRLRRKALCSGREDAFCKELLESMSGGLDYLKDT